MAHVRSITDAELEQEVLNSDLPVLIDFYADWCGPCKTLSPRIEALAADYVGTLKVVKVDVDANPAAVQMFRIQAMPTLVLVHERQVIDVLQGAVDRATLEELVGKVVTKKSGVETWDPQRLKLGMEAMIARPIDLRTAADFARARIPNAINIPRDELAQRLAELSELDADLVFYDRTDALVLEAATQAAGAGLSAGFLEGGMLGWEAEFLPVEKG